MGWCCPKAASRPSGSGTPGLLAEEVVQASLRLLEFVPRVGELVKRFRARIAGGARVAGPGPARPAAALCQRGRSAGGPGNAAQGAPAGGRRHRFVETP